ncbi:MaoC/PaaZ C-terminal domain-containing protein [Angustibacter aerolatus]
MRTIDLERPPRQLALLAGSLLPRRRPSLLPQTQVVRHAVRIDRDHLSAYQRVCGFAVRGQVPAGYLHVLSFPLQLVVMAEPAFPVPLPGLVHVANRWSLHRPVDVDEPLGLAVHAERLRPHRRGAQVDLVSTASTGGDVVWTGRSTYLARGVTVAAEPGGQPTDARATAGGDGWAPPQEDVTAWAGSPRAVWRFGSDAGRRYAAVSGDHNPIHLHPLTARPFGFRRAIAHGMYSVARCLAWLEPRTPEAHELELEFKRAVLLPGTVRVHATEQVGTHPAQAWTFALTSRDGDEHLRAALRAHP